MSNRKRISKHITKVSDVEEIVNITNEEASKRSTIMAYFADFGSDTRFKPYDTIDIPAGKYGKDKKNKNKFTTTVGLWIFNKSFIEPVSNILGYINYPVTKKVYGDLNKQLSYARLEDKITMEEFKNFILQSQILMSCCAALSPSHTDAIFNLNKPIMKKKKELEVKYKDAIENKDLTEIKKMEDELLNYSKELMKDDPSADMFNSGARSSWGNNFKNMYVMRGPVRLTDGSYDVITSSYMDGLDPKDFVKANDAAVGGPFSRSNKTREGGYKEKQYINATQHIKVLPKGSDCGTKRHINITLTKDNIDGWMYSFVINSNGTLTEITTDTKNKFIGKTVKMRFSAMCESKKNECICEKCMGTLPNRIGIENIGLGSMVMMSAVKNAAMKSFHDTSVNIVSIDPTEVF